tara:strand:- start:235 stop:426 length:192 start_codon:yes stop_codon:yes gene_type:complete
MLTRNTSINRLAKYGKNICVSVPAHDLGFIDVLNELAHDELMSKSQYLRKVVWEKKRTKQQSK